MRLLRALFASAPKALCSELRHEELGVDATRVLDGRLTGFGDPGIALEGGGEPVECAGAVAGGGGEVGAGRAPARRKQDHPAGFPNGR